MFPLLRVSGPALGLTREHDLIAAPRKGRVDWEAFERSAYPEAALASAIVVWRERAVEELYSLALFTELASHLQALGAPLDWSGAFARMIADEVRHTDLCLRMAAALGDTAPPPSIDERELHLQGAAPSRARVRETVVAAFCVGETLSGRMFKGARRATDVPLAADVVTAILVDEAFHTEAGWELGALLMRPDGPTFEAERDALAARLPGLFGHYATLCLARDGRAHAFREPERDPGPNFGTLSRAGYARAFFEGMEADVVPGLVAIGLPEAEAAYAELLVTLA
ncbi:MAG: ferritin-like domain-containing protein [Deltaproteobacteria bacterium]|nr:ferritin-like domain-containing protein [Deltaproteobacteria bacterium]